eukprot:COSAG05_NODE_21191_length_274_cov_0.308571_1_plen_51_part_01
MNHLPNPPSPDRMSGVSGKSVPTLRDWGAVRGEKEQTLEGHSENVNSASFS